MRRGTEVMRGRVDLDAARGASISRPSNALIDAGVKSAAFERHGQELDRVIARLADAGDVLLPNLAS